jgi:uncharacterized repeat protein (TIGR03803 family)
MVSKRFSVATVLVAVGLALPCAGHAKPVYEKLHDFDDDGDGVFPMAGLVADAGALYGTTGEGGTSGAGTVYKIDPSSGEVTVLHSFDQTDGFEPLSTLARHGQTLYGTTAYGGARAQGTLFQVDAVTGAFSTLYPFHHQTGRYPFSGLTYQAGTLYGTTHVGGDLKRKGTVYAFDLVSGAETVLHDFGPRPDGNTPASVPVFVAGSLYGVTVGGGRFGGGAVYKLDPASGAETIVYDFGHGADGAYPAGIVAKGNILFGATEAGGAKGVGTVFKVDVVTGRETVLFSFSDADGETPAGAPIEYGGALYGMTFNGGKGRAGVIYRLGLKDGAFSKLHMFSDAPDGAVPFGSLLYYQGAFYGTTSQGGVNGVGTVFRVTP